MKTYYRIKIEQDDDPRNPREDDNVGTMLCWHRRYSIGDDHQWKKDDPHIAMLALIRECDDVAADAIPPDDEAAIRAEFDKHYTSLPIFMYDHSGLTIKTSPFNCRWDSGQIGFIYCSHARAREQYSLLDIGFDWSDDNEKAVRLHLQHEVESVDKVLTGAVYGVTRQKLVYDFEQPDEPIKADDNTKDWQDDDSCWNFEGQDVESNGIVENLGEEFTEAAKKAMDNRGEWILVVEEDGKVTVAA